MIVFENAGALDARAKDTANHINKRGDRRGTITKHGYARRKKQSPEYSAWCEMKKRCLNTKSSGYENYGARGILVCKSWQKSFNNFLEDMGLRPSKLHSLDRIDNKKGYFPSNCRWATREVQNKNKRNCLYLIYQGKRMTISEVADTTGIKRSTLYSRVKRGTPLDELLGGFL